VQSVAKITQTEDWQVLKRISKRSLSRDIAANKFRTVTTRNGIMIPRLSGVPMSVIKSIGAVSKRIRSARPHLYFELAQSKLAFPKPQVDQNQDEQASYCRN
jgi:hypothetical protein